MRLFRLEKSKSCRSSSALPTARRWRSCTMSEGRNMARGLARRDSKAPLMISGCSGAAGGCDARFGRFARKKLCLRARAQLCRRGPALARPCPDRAGRTVGAEPGAPSRGRGIGPPSRPTATASRSRRSRSWETMLARIRHRRHPSAEETFEFGTGWPQDVIRRVKIPTTKRYHHRKSAGRDVGPGEYLHLKRRRRHALAEM